MPGVAKSRFSVAVLTGALALTLLSSVPAGAASPTSAPSGCGPGAAALSASARTQVVAPSSASGPQQSGTATATPRLVKDIDPSGDLSPEGFTKFGDDVFFRADKPNVGLELWKTDGTYQGTALVKDIRPGAEGSGLGGFTVAAGRLFFGATDGVHGYELWSSDGTSTGTSMVKDIDRGKHSADPRDLISFGGRVYFLATKRSLGADRSELWTSDGTRPGTHIVKNVDIHVDHYPQPSLVATHKYLFFAAYDGSTGVKLWRSDGTTGGTKVVPGLAPFVPYDLTVAGGKVYFGAYSAIGCALPPAGLYRSDGTAHGTVLLADPATADVAEPQQLASAGRRVFFVPLYTKELWTSDGTPNGTKRVRRFPGCSDWSCQTIYGLTKTGPGTIALFVAGSGLWKSDGTHAGTTFVAGASGAWDELAPVTMGGDVYFNGCAIPCGIGQLWRSDGTTLGTQAVADIYPGGDADPESLANIAGTLYFDADDGVHGRELWTYTP